MKDSSQGKFLLVSIFFVVLISVANAGTFYFPDDVDLDSAQYRIDDIVHPQGYNGNGGELIVTVCITPDNDPQGGRDEQLVIPTQNAIRTWNALIPAHGNIIEEASGVTGFDAESAVLHELGHCTGLGHTNLSSTSGVMVNDQDYAPTTNGQNNAFDLDPGNDEVPGSADDVRGDDKNFAWFQKNVNNPFTVGSTVDSSTYSILLEDLPSGDSFVASAAREVGNLMGYPNSEAVMQQGTKSGEVQRILGHDDVAMRKLAMSGIDRTQGTSDDYTLKLNYLGVSNSPSCNIQIVINLPTSGVSQCFADRFAAGSNGSGHWRLNYTTIRLDTDTNWFFNQVSNAIDTDNDSILDFIENATCTDIADADTDDDGLSDGTEDANQNGVVDAGETDPCNADSDGDLIQDGTESGVTAGVTGTDSGIFIPDADPATVTSPLLSDTDNDGFQDGAEDLNANGRVDAGESDPDDINSLPIQTTTVPWWSLPSEFLFLVLILNLALAFGIRQNCSRR